jgi:uncharacterized RDD family membrane protein YckC
MALTSDQAAKRPTSREIIVEFSPTAMRAPFALRLGSVLIDYILVLAVPVLGLLLDLLLGSEPAKISNNTAWFLAFLLGISDLIILPGLSGQTLGMMLCGLRIVRSDGKQASIGKIALRNTVGYLATALTMGLGFLLAAFTPSGRALHDYIAGTIVVFGKKRALK